VGEAGNVAGMSMSYGESAFSVASRRVAVAMSRRAAGVGTAGATRGEVGGVGIVVEGGEADSSGFAVVVMMMSSVTQGRAPKGGGKEAQDRLQAGRQLRQARTPEEKPVRRRSG